MMEWNDDRSPYQLLEALKEDRREEARQLIDDFVLGIEEFADRVPAELAEEVLEILASFALFNQILRVGQTLRRFAQDAPIVRWWIARSLVEQGSLTQAIQEVQVLQDDLKQEIEALSGTTDFQKSRLKKELEHRQIECLGLLGRAYQELYLDARPRSQEPRAHDLDKALGYYLQGYHRDPEKYFRYGVNYVALLTHRRRVETDGRKRVSEEAIEMAKELSKRLPGQASADGPVDHHSLRSEICLTLGENREAAEAIASFVDHDSVDAIKVNEVTRQFERVWDLTEYEPPGNKILPLLKQASRKLDRQLEQLTKRPGTGTGTGRGTGTGTRGTGDGRLRGTGGGTGGPPVLTGSLERVMTSPLVPLPWLQQGQKQAGAVAKIQFKSGGGTGFLIDGETVHERFQDQPLLLTAAFIFGGESPRAAVSFEAGDLALKARTMEKIWESNDASSPVILLGLADFEKLPRIPVAGEDPEPGTHLHLIGYPLLGALSYSLFGLRVDQIDARENDPLIYYRCETEPGTSGSPVFNHDWQAVALHIGKNRTTGIGFGVSLVWLLEKIRSDLAGE